jgi:hypothetical protein
MATLIAMGNKEVNEIKKQIPDSPTVIVPKI